MPKCNAWPIPFYGMETRTLKAVIIIKIEALEMCILEPMLRISYQFSAAVVIKRRKIAYLDLGHIIRGYHFQHLILQGKIERGSRRIERKQIVLAEKYPSMNGNKKLPSTTSSCRTISWKRRWTLQGNDDERSHSYLNFTIRRRKYGVCNFSNNDCFKFSDGCGVTLNDYQ